MPETLEVQYDECAVLIKYLDARSGFSVDLQPYQARMLAAELLGAAADVEELRHIEQMQG